VLALERDADADQASRHQDDRHQPTPKPLKMRE
jgi:hypothetical protein